MQTLKVARIDATQNDVPLEYSKDFTADGYPAFRLVKGGNNQVIAYDGERSPRALIHWAQGHVATPFSFDPVEVNFLSSIESLSGLGDSVRNVFKQNQELRLEVRRLTEELNRYKANTEIDIPTETEAEMEVGEKKRLGVEVRKARERAKAMEDAATKQEAREYASAEAEAKKAEVAAERLVKAQVESARPQSQIPDEL